MITQVLGETKRFIADRPLAYWVPLAAPMILIAAYEQFWPYVGIPSALFGALLFAILAVNVHRLTLEGQHSVHPLGLPSSASRTFKFFGYYLAIQLLSYLPTPVAAFFAIYAFDSITLYIPLAAIVFFVTTFFVSRFSLVLPATAIDLPIFMSGSWRLTRNHKLAALMIYAILPLALVLPAASLAFYDVPGSTFVVSLAVSLLATFGIVSLSILYRELASIDQTEYGSLNN